MHVTQGIQCFYCEMWNDFNLPWMCRYNKDLLFLSKLVYKRGEGLYLGLKPPVQYVVEYLSPGGGGGGGYLPGCRIQFLMVSLFHWVTLKNTYIQHEGVSDTVYTRCVSLDGMEISWPTSTVWFALLNSTFTWPKVNYTVELCFCFYLCSRHSQGREVAEVW